MQGKERMLRFRMSRDRGVERWKLLFFSILPPSGLLPVLGPLERYMMPTLDSALLISSRAGKYFKIDTPVN